jgi:hypothetical protein
VGVQQTNTAMASLDSVTRSNVDTTDRLNNQALTLTQNSHELSETTKTISQIIFGNTTPKEEQKEGVEDLFESIQAA